MLCVLSEIPIYVVPLKLIILATFDALGRLSFSRSFGFLDTGDEMNVILRDIAWEFKYSGIVSLSRCSRQVFSYHHTLLGWPNAFT